MKINDVDLINFLKKKLVKKIYLKKIFQKELIYQLLKLV